MREREERREKGKKRRRERRRRKGEREGERIYSTCWFTFQTFTSQGSAKPKPDSGNLMPVYHVIGWHPTTWPSPAASMVPHEQEAGIGSRTEPGFIQFHC